MQNQIKPKQPPTISTIMAILMIIIALLFDGLQFILALTVFGSLLALPVGWFAEISFAMWYYLIGALSLRGKKTGLKMFSIFGSAIIESVPLVDGLPAITAGVIGVIISTRIEDKMRKPPTQSARGRALPPAANDNDSLDEQYQEAA